MATIGERIRVARRSLGLTQQEAVAKITKGLTVLREWEAGKREVSEGDLVMLAESFFVRLDWLKSGEEPMREASQASMTSRSVKTGPSRSGIPEFNQGDSQVFYKFCEDENGASYYVKIISVRISVKQAHQEMKAAGIPFSEEIDNE